MEYINTKTINRIICFSLLIFSFSLIFIVSKYIGIIGLFSKVLKALLPVFIAIIISFMVEPLVGYLIGKGFKRKYSTLIVYAFLVLFLGVILYFLIPSFVEQIGVFVSGIPGLLSIVIEFLTRLGISINEIKFANFINEGFVDFSKKVIDYLTSSFSILFNVALGVSGAVFLSFDFPKFRDGIKNYIPKRIRKPVIYYLEKFLPFVHKYFMGMLLDAFFVFVICIIGFSIINIDYKLVLSIIIAITNLIPIIGPYIGGIPAIIVGFNISSVLGISSIIIVVLVQIIESGILQPLILKNVIKLHPLEGILGISLFGTLFGVIGMIFSPILVVAIKLLFIPYNEKENICVNNQSTSI